MVADEDIRHVAAQLAEAANAERVILFGSYARGEATDESDVDLMIIAENELPRFKRTRTLYGLMKPHPFAMDLVVYTPSEIEKGRRSSHSFVSRVLEDGKTVYAR